MRPTRPRSVDPWWQRPDYATYKSPYGPNYKTVPHFHGVNAHKIIKYGTISATFGVALGVMGLFFVAEVPKVRSDILSKLPIVGGYWVREVPPEDNPF